MRSLQTTRNAAFKAALLAGGAGFIAMAQPAFAQDQGKPVTTNEPVACDPAAKDCPAPAGNAVTEQNANPAQANQGIVVTGSRIVRQDYSSNSPLVTVDKSLLAQSSTAAIEQNLNKLPQFTPAKTPTGGGDIQPTATNTPGAATVSLRGLGANRNLVLLDGRRATPSNASGAVDINSIPSAAVERVEIISGGASATYGADAVAGVTNFILKKNFQGIELDGQFGVSQHGDGKEYQVSGIMGSDFADNRGNVSIAMSYNKREPSYYRNRSWYQRIWNDPTTGAGGRFFVLYPGATIGDGNSVAEGPFRAQFPGTTNANLNSAGLTIYQVPGTNTLFSGVGLFAAPSSFGGVPFFTNAQNKGLQQGDLAVVNSNGALKFVDTTPYLFLPLTRYNMFFRGNYEINDWIGVFGQGLYSNTKTHTTQQGGAITSGWDVFVPYGTGVYTGSAIPTSAYGSVDLPSSVILNGMRLDGSLYSGTPTSGNGVFVDSTPGDLTDNPTNPVFKAKYGSQYSCANAAVGGCTNNQVIGQFFPAQYQALLNARQHPARPGDPGYIPGAPPASQPMVSGANDRVALAYGFPQNRSVDNTVATYSMMAGLEGSIPGTDWTWEAFGSRGVTDTYTLQTGVWSLARIRTLLQAPGFGKGFIGQSNNATTRNQFGATTATCTTGMNIFALSWDQISQDCKNAIAAPLKNNQHVSQTIWEANATGTLFELPAGPLKAALGASYRKLNFAFVNDTITEQGASFLDMTIGIYPSADVHASYNVKELYGELLVPVLKDIPAIQSLSLELGARVSDYNTTGTSYTYKILGDWEVTDWLRLRGGFNRAERSPNAAELFLSPSEVFGVAGGPDLCSQNAVGTYAGSSANAAAPGNSAAAAADVVAVCRAIMESTGGPGTANQYYTQAAQPAGAGFAFVLQSGNPNLKPEKANTWTAGAVVRSPFTTPWLSRLRFSVDWWKIHLTHAIGVQSQVVKQLQCLSPTYNPSVAGAAGSAAKAAAAAASAACVGIRYNPLPALGIGTTDVTYTNSGEVDVSGIDGQLDYSVDVGPGTFTANVLLNYYLHYKSRELPTNPMIDYTGTLGTSQNALNAGAYRYRVLTTVGYSVGPVRASLQWQHLPSIRQEGSASVPDPSTYPITGYKAYDLFNLDVNYQVTGNVEIRAGVDNVFNKAPPLGGVNTTLPPAVAPPGGGFDARFYDINGRRFFIGANMKF